MLLFLLSIVSALERPIPLCLFGLTETFSAPKSVNCFANDV